MRVRITDNFSANLQSIEDFCAGTGFPQGFDRLLDELDQSVIPNLERYPEMGRPFSRHPCESVEALVHTERQTVALSSIREYLLEDYLLLYLPADAVYLLAIKHHKQLSYDFDRLWLNR